MSLALGAGNARDTIFALASGAGSAAISVIRVSGERAAAILGGMAGALPPPRRASLRILRDGAGAVLDRAMVLWMPGPASYTGEDTAELHLHGGRAVREAVTRALLGAGARPADAGEFSRRAFLAGKMDLLEAEAIGDLVASETETQRTLALSALMGGVAGQIQDWSTRITRCLAFQEALIDFPDETADATAEAMIRDDIEALIGEIADHLARAKAGERVRSGLVFAIVGPPNVGKSSLFNAMAGREVAIVSSQPGTTRDALEVHLDLGGVAVTLVDTAGLRETLDVVEAEGIRRAKARAANADLVIHVTDVSSAVPGDVGPADLVVFNKIDLGSGPAGAVGVSAKTGAGLECLVGTLTEHARRLTRSERDPVLSHARHVAALRDAREGLEAALTAGLPELRGEELRLALNSIARLAGRIDTEAVLDVVFGAFCIGK
jgi:tRNA modification GTPase